MNDNTVVTEVPEMVASLVLFDNAAGFGRAWALNLTWKGQTKQFYLGQDAKVALRFCGQSPEEFTRAIIGSDGPLIIEGPDNVADKVAAYLLETLLLRVAYDGYMGTIAGLYDGIMACDDFAWAVE